MNKFLKTMFFLIFGDWNGIQIFVAPTIMLFLFNQSEFVYWITGILSYQKYYMPLLIYITSLFSIFFLCIKVVVIWKNEAGKTKVNIFKSLLIPFFIKLHKWLLAFVTIILLVFILKSGLTYFYRISLPIFIVYYWIIRIGAIFLTIYLYALLEISVPLIKKGRSLFQAQKYFHLLVCKHWKHFVAMVSLQLLWIYISILLFSLAINQLQILADMSKSYQHLFQINFPEVHSLKQLLINIATLLGAFLFSNLLYSPFMMLVNKGLRHFKLTLKSI